MKIGIELIDKTFRNIDLSNPEEGNPGIGGSEYLFLLLGVYLHNYGSYESLCYYHYNMNSLPENIEDTIVSDEIEMLNRVEADGVDVFIYQINKPKHWYEFLSTTSINAIAWAHVYLEYYEIGLLSKCANIKRVVFVGKEEYDAYIDNDIIIKAACIYNMINTNIPFAERFIDDPEITYVGALVHAKGFHVLARNYQKIKERVPAVKLNVIGTGQVYDRNITLGKYGIAEQEYEDSFMKYLTDDNGKVMDSVNFLGILGKEKGTVFAHTSVGITNPTALTETFCLSAVEMELSGVPVISRKKWGMLDTIDSGNTGYLFTSEADFVNKITELLLNKEKNLRMGENARHFVQEKFEASILVEKWKDLIFQVSIGEPAVFQRIENNYSNDYKWVKAFIRFIRFGLGLSLFPDYEKQKNFFRRIKRRLVN